MLLGASLLPLLSLLLPWLLLPLEKLVLLPQPGWLQ